MRWDEAKLGCLNVSEADKLKFVVGDEHVQQ
jgi:hypothetical protein